MSAPAEHYTAFTRLLHWLMAAMILAMLFIGVGMVASISSAHEVLIAVHRPLGIAILLLVLIRLANRLAHRAPPLPSDLPLWQRLMAKASQVLLYALMLAMPLIGWSMLSAGNYPIVMFGAVHLPAIAPASPALYAFLRQAHTYLAFVLFAVFLLHLAGALFHGLIRRDGVLASMVHGPGRKEDKH
ncbi:cytochrome b [Dyella tabacisoli]|uniref:Cytochrome b n=1 Tax=Dyella tabacisoli TaxID=2282381 RepID=A0A369ULN1_9GAMM|nr:cytochrome b [Dyella tabacisoli]RDD81664.1 cytochrome b [Dyella tabacisoli]